MPTDNIVKVRVGVPGPPGAGVSAAEKATFLTASGGTLTGPLKFTPSADGSFVLFEQQDGTDLVVLDTANKKLKFYAGLDLEFYSDAGSTLEASIDGATGNASFNKVIVVEGIEGDQPFWGFVIDGGGSKISTGVKYDYPIPYDALISGWELVADQSGSVVIDLWQDTYANFPPTVADSITTSEKPTLSSVQKNTDTSLNSGNGWAVTGGRYLRLNVDSATTVTRVTLKLFVTRT